MFIFFSEALFTFHDHFFVFLKDYTRNGLVKHDLMKFNWPDLFYYSYNKMFIKKIKFAACVVASINMSNCFVLVCLQLVPIVAKNLVSTYANLLVSN